MGDEAASHQRPRECGSLRLSLSADGCSSDDVTAFEGTIDEDYRGRIMVKLFNHSDEEFKTGALTRIAQLIIQPYSTPVIDVVEELEDSERGAGGFGSTGTI